MSQTTVPSPPDPTASSPTQYLMSRSEPGQPLLPLGMPVVTPSLYQQNMRSGGLSGNPVQLTHWGQPRPSQITLSGWNRFNVS